MNDADAAGQWWRRLSACVSAEGQM